jgi:hypothetical protein
MPRSLVVLLLLVAACKGPEDYLADIKSSVEPESGRLDLGVFDGGLLVHEAFQGLMKEEVLTLSQAARAAHHAAWLLDTNEIGLLRADAVSCLVHIALRFPFPPAAEPYAPETKVGETAFAEIEKLHAATAELEVDALLPTLASPDRAVVERGLAELRRRSGQDLGSDSGRWEAWWAERRPAALARAASEAAGPVGVLGRLRYGSLSSARAVLGYLGVSLLGYDVPELRPALRLAITRIGRQVAIFGVQRALRDEDPVVRAAGYRATMDLLDPAFAEPLHERARPGVENDLDARICLLQALSFYPGRRALEPLLLELSEERQALAWAARRSLVDLCGCDLGDDEGAWLQWYETEGKLRWP